MWRRFVYTLLGVLAGYLLGAIVGMTAFAAIYGFRSISVLEESNRNRWAFVAAAAGAVLGGLVAWWRSYTDLPPGARRGGSASGGGAAADVGDEASQPAPSDVAGSDRPSDGSPVESAVPGDDSPAPSAEG